MSLRLQNLSRHLLHIYFFVKHYLFWFFAAAFLYLLFILGQQGISFLNKLKIKPQDLLGFFGQSNESLNNQNSITNFLVLGIRGEGSDSPNLSDSIIFFSLNQNTKQVTQVGIPRDLWVPTLQAKINTAYHYGEEASPGAGIKLAEASVEEILGQPVDYTVVVNFNLFKQVIDLVGGVEINVSPAFEDKEYPIPGKESALPISSRYETITFPEGLNIFNGETALKYVRSRHSVGQEGTDFARSRRQQQIISALKDKIFTKEFLLNKNKIDNLVNLANSNLITNISPSLYPVLARTGLELSSKPIKSIGLSTEPDKDGVSILYNPPPAKFKGEWVLVPKDNNWKALKQYIATKLAE